MRTAQDLLAPWAEQVPGHGPMTVDDMLALPDDGWQYELVDGRLVRMPGSGFEASMIALRLASAVLSFVDAHALGRMTGSDGTYNLTQPGDSEETGLIPDLAFVRAERLPPRSSPEYAKALHLAPDLAVEVVSPSRHRLEMAAKVQRYLAAGVRLVGMVWPRYQQVDVWRAGGQRPEATLGLADALDGLDVLPGFTYPAARLFG